MTGEHAMPSMPARAFPSLLVPDAGGRPVDHGPSMLGLIEGYVPDAIRRLGKDSASTRAVDAFLDRVGGDAGIPVWLAATRRRASLLDDAHMEELRLAEVRAAALLPWSPDAEATDPFTDMGATVADLLDLADVEDHPLGTGEALRAANVPCPYLLACRDVAWPGVDAGDVREAARTRAPGDADAALADGIAIGADVDLSDWWGEDAHPLIDVDGLRALVAQWLPHAGSGDAEDTALEAEVDAWNAANGVAASHPDPTRLYGTAPDVTHADCVAWHEARIAALLAEAAPVSP